VSRLFLSKVFVRFSLLCIAILLAFFIYSISVVRGMSYEALVSGLEQGALTVRGAVAPLMARGRSTELEELTRSMARESGQRITLIDARGVVLADSEEDPARMENHSLRPEVAAAMLGERGVSSRLSSTVRRWNVYVALPVTVNGSVHGVVRTASPQLALDAEYPREATNLLLFLGPLLVVCLLFALAFSRSILSPLRDLAGAVTRFASGDFGARLHLRRRDEIRDLAEAFNAMGERVQGLFQDSALRAQELDGIFSSVQQGIVLLDRAGRIVRCNRGFEDLVGAPAVKGRTLWELVRAPRLTELVQEARSTGERDELIVVLHDTSDIRRLEAVKRDFVVNASHELRTPLTSIRGSLEMLEGQLSGDSERWVDTIRRNAGRMSAIVEDLLLLSSLEARGVESSRESVSLAAIVGDVAGMFAARAQAKGLSLKVSVDPSLPSVSADSFLLEQMLVNLLDNALKFTESGEVGVRVSTENGRARIDVSDTGIGIAEEHIPRLFERFYVVDKSRSRKLGGTGLGLSIVKHIVQSHGGSVTVESAPGRGTTFTIRLPID